MLPPEAAMGAGGGVKSQARHLEASASVKDLLAHPVIGAWAAHLLPRPEDAGAELALGQIGRLMPWHGHVHPEEGLAAVNRMIDDEACGLPVFFPFHKDAGKASRTGLFFLRGKEGAPFALICPGGGFRYVGTLHEGLPLAQAISAQGFNAFVLQYRAGGERIACGDMALALGWIFKHAVELAISTKNYSVWGGSAGARMAADLGSYGAKLLGGADLPKPSAVIMAYTGHDWASPADPPTWAIVSRDDPIAPATAMLRRIQALRELGVEAEIQVVNGAGHGFGLGSGTEAEGWVDKAIAFWRRQIEKAALK